MIGRPAAAVATPGRPTADARGDVPRLLAGPPVEQGPESFASHLRRLGTRPTGGLWLIDMIETAGLQGRGGAWFSTARRWRGLASRSNGRAVVLVNVSEGEPLSAKDRTLALARPHLILDGAELAASSVGASEIVIYIARPFRDELRALQSALRQRRRHRPGIPVRMSRVAHRYIAGESSAAVRRASGGRALPSFAPPSPSEVGVDGRPTLVQNAETLAHVALIARHGPDWFRQCGTDTNPGTTLLTISGAVRWPGVHEVSLGITLAEAILAAGGSTGSVGGALIGGYFGSWVRAETLARARLDSADLAAHGAALGCGVLAVLPEQTCGLAEASRIATYMASESAGQCGPCIHGLTAIAEVMASLVAGTADATSVAALRRWAAMVSGRGACHHPDGAIANLLSALDVFDDHLPVHLSGSGACGGMATCALPPPPRAPRGRR